MKQSTILWYFADPMCSWCWGFSPVIEKIKTEYDDQLKIALILGGLRPGTTEAMDGQLRDEILHHWHEVHRLTGQDFTPDGAMPEGFVYDTEPPSRAVMVVAELDSTKILPYFKSIQSAFYVEQKDVTDEKVLTDLAQQQNISEDSFHRLFHADTTRQKLQKHFIQSRQAGVKGFPALALQCGKEYKFISNGYRSFDEIKIDVNQWLDVHG